MGLSSWSLDHIAFSWRVIPKAFRIKDPWESWNYQRKPWVWTLGGLVTYDVIFFIHLGSRKIHAAFVTPHPNEACKYQGARNLTMEAWGNVRLFPAGSQDPECPGPMQCRERLGGLLKYYAREAA